MHSVDLDMLQMAITPSAEKLAKHSVKSVRQRVANMADIVPGLKAEDLGSTLTDYFCDSSRCLSDAEISAIEELQKSYDDPAFILGKAL